MSEWKEYRLDEIADILNSKRVPLSSQVRAKRKGNYPYYGASGIVDYIDNYLFEGEHVLISEDGENLRSRQTPIAFKANGKFWVNNHAHIVKGKKPFLNDWLVYYFKNLDINPYITGAVQPKLNKENLLSIRIRLPDFATAERIAEVLSSLDDKIEINNQINKNLEALAQALFKQWFVDFEFPNENGQPYKSSGGEMVESELGMIPKGWNTQKVSDVCKVINGRAYKDKEFELSGTPIIRIQNLNGRKNYVYSNLELEEDKYVDKDELIFAWSATFGPFIWRGQRSIYHYHIWKLNCYNDSCKYFLFHHLKREATSVSNLGTGSIFTHITKSLMESQRLLKPPIKIVELFHNQVSNMDKQVSIRTDESESLSQLRDALLPKLISGQLKTADSNY